MKLIELGVLGKVHGLDGWLRYYGEPVLSYLEKVYLEDRGERRVIGVRTAPDWLVHLEGVRSRDEALELTGLRLFAMPEWLPPPEQGSYYYFQLKGLPVYVKDELFGWVVDLEWTGVQDLLVVEREAKCYWVPLQAPYVEVRPQGLWIDPIPGLLD